MANFLEFQIQKELVFVQNSRLSPIEDLINGVYCGSVVNTLFHPLDVAQILMQTNSKDAKEDAIHTLAHLYENYGLSSWFRGNLASCIFTFALASGNFIHSSPLVRNVGTQPFSNFAFNACVTTLVFPLRIAKIRMITNPGKYKNLLDTIKTVYKEEELPTLYRGLGITLLSILMNGILTSASLKVISSFWNKNQDNMKLWERLLIGTLGTVIAGLVQYPIDTALKIVQSQENSPDNIGRTLLNTGRIPRTGGFTSLYNGFGTYLIKSLAIPFQSKLIQTSKNIILMGKNAWNE